MAVSSGLTSLEDFETGGTYVNIGGGPGAGDNTDIIIEGSQSGARREDNQTDHGFWADTGANNDLSAAGTHVKFWYWHTHFAVASDFRFYLGTGTANNYEYYPWPATEYPSTGGWVPVWVEVGNASGVPTGTLTTSQIRYFGVSCDTPNVGGAAQNQVVDEIMYGTTGLTWSGVGGDFSDFRTYETSNVEGVLLTRAGVDFCYARLTLGDSSATGFSDSDGQLIFPDQALVSTTFMGLTVDLQNASTAIDLTDYLIASGDPAGATNRPDLLVTGTSGTFDLTGVILNGLRVIEIGDNCTLTSCTVNNSGQIDAAANGTAGAVLDNCTIQNYTGSAGTAAVLWNVNADPDGNLDDCTFVKGTGTVHAIEFGTSSPTTMTLRGIQFSGYNASNGQNDSAIYIARNSGTVTINIVGGGNTPSYRTAGATVVINNNTSITLTGLKDNTEIRVFTAGTTTELAGIETATAGSADARTFTFSLAASTVVDIRIIHGGDPAADGLFYEIQAIKSYTIPVSDTSLPIQQVRDRNYSNP